jgi:cytochrome P450
MVEPLFTKAHIASMRPHIQGTFDNLLTTMIEKGSDEPLDIVENLALPLASYVS